MDGLQWKTLLKWMIGGENPLFSETSILLLFFKQRCDMSSAADGIFLGWLTLSVFCLTVGENSVERLERDFEGMSELFDWIYGDQIVVLTLHWLVAFPLNQLLVQQRYDVQFLVVRKPPANLLTCARWCFQIKHIVSLFRDKICRLVVHCVEASF